jgi:predicted transcriptional regulator
MIHDILTITNGGATITQIMFKAYMSHSQVKSYLGELVEKGCLDRNSIDRKYRTTAKGRECLQAMDRMSEILTIDIRRSVANKQLLDTYQF